jgi:aryl-alcohol dehydrogenase-like predicted oxidoreductase
MKTLRLGSTGLEVTPIGLGLAAIGRPGYITVGRHEDLGDDRSVDALRARADALLDTAYSAEVRYIDAARSYGRAEEFLASWLERRRMPPGALTVGSKWGYTYVANWQVGVEVNEVKDHSLATLSRQLGESRALLGPSLRLYQIHSATLESGVLSDVAVLSELVRQRELGLAIGLTVSGPRQGEVRRAALAVRIDGVNPFQVVQATWNVLEPSAGPALEEAHSAGFGVIVKEALANGRLARSDSEHAALLERIASRPNGSAPTADAVGIAAALAQPWADVVLSGAVTTSQLVSNLAALELQIATDRLAELTAAAIPAERYWDERSRLAWS